MLSYLIEYLTMFFNRKIIILAQKNRIEKFLYD